VERATVLELSLSREARRIENVDTTVAGVANDQVVAELPEVVGSEGKTPG